MTTATIPDLQAALPTATWQDWSCLVRLAVSDQSALEPAAADLHSLMSQVEHAVSRFRHDSELSHANNQAGRPTPVSATATMLIAGALQAAIHTDGAVDPTLGGRLAELGYDRDIALLTEITEPVPGFVGRPTWRDVKLDRELGLVTVPMGCQLDLGATAKAQTADWAADQLHRRFGCDVLVEIGGDLAVQGQRSWQLTVAERAGDPGQQIAMNGGGLTTSTTIIRSWRRNGQLMHHILDPRTGMPAAGPWRTVTVAAPSAVAANALSTAAIVLGEHAVSWLNGQQMAARLVDSLGEITVIGGWPS